MCMRSPVAYMARRAVRSVRSRLSSLRTACVVTRGRGRGARGGRGRLAMAEPSRWMRCSMHASVQMVFMVVSARCRRVTCRQRRSSDWMFARLRLS